MIDVGVSLQAERRYFDLVAPLAAAQADYIEVCPETLWRTDADDHLVANAYHAEIVEFVRANQCGVVAHGTGLSLGGADPRDELRLDRWLQRIADDHAVFDYRWYTDHLGPSTLAGATLQLPIALPYLDATAQLVRERLAALQRIVPDVGFENTVHYFLLGEWLDEPAWMARALVDPRTWILLDLHNVWTMGQNLGKDPRAWLAKIDFSRVVEIHVSGGSESDPAWLPDRSTLRLDSHDDGVPEPVWELLDEVLPRCANLRGVTLERMENSVDDTDVPQLAAELERIRRTIRASA